MVHSKVQTKNSKTFKDTYIAFPGSPGKWPIKLRTKGPKVSTWNGTTVPQD